MIFRPANHFIKWYWETPDLGIVFNTGLMRSHNPLLVLGPYGSLCWRGVVEGWSLGHIRHEASRVFGEDEVDSFLRRLASLGMIEGEVSALDPPTPSSLVKEFAAPSVQFQMVQSRIPWYCLWELCLECDLRCRLCYQPAFAHPGLSEEEAERVAAELIATGIFYVCLLGGEPLLRGDLERIVRQLREGGVYTKVITNGQRLSAARADALAEAGLNQVEVSFDGLHEKTHDSSRGEGSYRRALEALGHARQAGIPRGGMVWTVHSGNFDEANGLPDFLDRSGVTECYLSRFKKTGLNGSTAPWNPLVPGQLERLQEKIECWRSSHPHLTIVLLPSCSCGRTSVVVGAEGGVRTCSFSAQEVGHLRQASLLRIWSELEADLPEIGHAGYCSGQQLYRRSGAVRTARAPQVSAPSLDERVSGLADSRPFSVTPRSHEASYRPALRDVSEKGFGKPAFPVTNAG